MLAHHFSHYNSRKCRRMVLELTGVISPWEPLDVTNVDKNCSHVALHQ